MHHGAKTQNQFFLTIVPSFVQTMYNVLCGVGNEASTVRETTQRAYGFLGEAVTKQIENKHHSKFYTCDRRYYEI